MLWKCDLKNAEPLRVLFLGFGFPAGIAVNTRLDDPPSTSEQGL